MSFSLVILGVLLLLSFFFSCIETAVTAASKPLLYEMEKADNKNARRLNKLLEKPERLIGTLLLGNNLVNIAFTALATALMIHFFGEYGVIIATFGVSFILLAFGEILPKTLALQNPTPIATAVSPVLLILTKLLMPFVATLNFLTKITLRLLHIKNVKQKQTEYDARAEIRGAIELQPNTPHIKQEKNILKSVLELSEITVGDIMTHRSNVVTLNANLSTREIIEFVSASVHSRIPVWSGRRDNVIGILHTGTLLKKLNSFYQRHMTQIDLTELLEKPWFVLESTTLLDQLHAFKNRRAHFALVVDEYGALQGLITLEDLLEEIVGNINEKENGNGQLNFDKLEDGSWRIAGNAQIRDINRILKWNLSDENASTLAGLLMYTAERIPDMGQTFEIQGYTMTVVSKNRNRLRLIDVVPPQRK